MEFLGIGYQELLLVLVLLLVVVGPERLPGMAYQIGRAVRQMQGYARAVRDEFKDEIDYLDDQYKTLKGQVDDVQNIVRTEQQKLNSELRDPSLDPGGLLPSEPLLPALPDTQKPTPTTENDAPTAPPMVF